MSNPLGEFIGGGFRPNEPSLDAMLQSIKRSTEEGEAPKPSESQKKREDLDRCYAQFASSPGGKQILEDLLNVTMRSTHRKADGFESIEACALAAEYHQGKCDLMSTILARIVRGQNLPAPSAAKKKSKKKS